MIEAKNITIDENELLPPAQAVEFLNTHRNAEMTVDILRQMRRKGRIKGIPLGDGNSKVVVYRVGDLLNADINRRKAGRPRAENKEKQN